MLARRLFLGSIILLLAHPADGRSQRTIGLVQDIEGMSKAEAMTTSARGGSALFYNPACLIYNRFDFRLAGIEGIVDRRLLTSEGQNNRETMRDTNARSKGDEDLKKAYDLLLSDQPLNAVLNARLIDFVIPYVGVQSFASTELTAGHVPDAQQPTVQADITLRTGTIGGIGIKIGPWAIGYSKYFLIESSLKEQLTLDQIDSIKSKVEADPDAVSTIPYRDFTNASYGNTDGHNFGLLYQPFDDNPSGVGVAVLNAGGSSFRRPLPRRYSKLNTYQKDLEKKADEYGIDLGLPARIPQEVNLGLLVGHGGGPNDIFTANLALDYDDIGGAYLDASKKLASSTEIGLMLPDAIAMLLRGPLWISDKGESNGYYMGLLGLKATAGMRAHDRYAYGFTLLGHGGTRAVSFLKFTVQALVEKPLDSARAERAGAQVSVGLTFIFIQ